MSLYTCFSLNLCMEIARVCRVLILSVALATSSFCSSAAMMDLRAWARVSISFASPKQARPSASHTVSRAPCCFGAKLSIVL